MAPPIMLRYSTWHCVAAARNAVQWQLRGVVGPYPLARPRRPLPAEANTAGHAVAVISAGSDARPVFLRRRLAARAQMPLAQTGRGTQVVVGGLGQPPAKGMMTARALGLRLQLLLWEETPPVHHPHQGSGMVSSVQESSADSRRGSPRRFLRCSSRSNVSRFHAAPLLKAALRLVISCRGGGGNGGC